MNKYENKTALIEFGGGGCANCISLMPILNELGRKFSIEVYHEEIREEISDIIEHYQIHAVPLVLLIRNGKEIGRVQGYQPYEILEIWLENKMSQN